MMDKMVGTFQSVDEIHKWDHSNESLMLGLERSIAGMRGKKP